MKFGKKKKSIVQKAINLPIEVVSGVYDTVVRKPYSYVSHKLTRRKGRKTRFGSRRSRYVPVSKRLCRRHHRRSYKVTSRGSRRGSRGSLRRSRFGVAGPGFPGPVSYPMPVSVDYFGAQEPFVNPSSWWYPQGGVPRNLIPETLKR
jgi:hypothetical protein